ncbi:MAG: acetyltransferase [Sediminibacterium sp.]|jgi:sugar O-acyltransferase (sialic acid O-acetyltransferase NeuD family)|uniref:acetyltransferase n=1 Tax=Sediminibacterium sp. TaxID=1917865 RepID=UPI002AB86204|nr:acetyltransferase [Sediminibacterium sp.]MDZ4070728.1 acetyltransferase [Sediminibacterium sp.]
MKDNLLYIYGVGGHSKVVANIADLNNQEIGGFLDDNPSNQGKYFLGKKVFGSIDSVKQDFLFLAIGDNKSRYRLDNVNTGRNWKTLIHPSAIISKDVQIGDGTVIMAGAILQAGTKIGKHCIINTGACIDHDCIIDDFAHVAPNATLAGGISIGKGVLIGVGTSIIPSITIGEWSVVGAGSVVVNNQPSHCTIIGIPAKPIKFHNEE